MGENSIVTMLERISDTENAQDNKMLLLASMFEQRLDDLEERTEKISDELKKTTDTLTTKLEETNSKLDSFICRFDGVDKRSIGYLTLLSQHPKIVKFMLWLIAILFASDLASSVVTFLLR